jgi:hypothetical protein
MLRLMRLPSARLTKAILLVGAAAFCVLIAEGALKHFWWDHGGDMDPVTYIVIGALWLCPAGWCLVVAARSVLKR